jgi:type I restriction enzyme M protein
MLADRGADDSDEEENGDDDAPKKGLPEKKKKKLLDGKTWERDGKLVEVAMALRKEIGGELFEDHNTFRDTIYTALNSPSTGRKSRPRKRPWRRGTRKPRTPSGLRLPT